jgi:hypothetical protein
MNKNYRTAYILAVVTIFYNLAEGLVSMWFGYVDATLTLFGFGVDSLVEVVSSIGVWHMIKRIQASQDTNSDTFEQRALRITGGSFYTLGVGLLIIAGINTNEDEKGTHVISTSWRPEGFRALIFSRKFVSTLTLTLNWEVYSHSNI